MRIFVKICGLTTPETVRAAVEAGADALGFVLAPSPRQLTPEQAGALAAEVPPGILRVAVMLQPTAAEWEAVTAVFRPDWLQAEAAAVNRLRLPAGTSALPVYRDVPGLDSAALAREDRALFEAAVSGAGQAPDWQHARALASKTELMLAGGLTPENVGSVIGTVRPWGVDVSSGVEARRGVKDPARIAAFVAAVRRAEREVDSAAR